MNDLEKAQHAVAYIKRLSPEKAAATSAVLIRIAAWLQEHKT